MNIMRFVKKNAIADIRRKMRARRSFIHIYLLTDTILALKN